MQRSWAKDAHLRLQHLHPTGDDVPFYFAQLADTQLGMEWNNAHWDNELEKARAAVVALNAMTPRPSFAIVCGDMVHAFPAPKTMEVRAKEILDFKSVFSEVHDDIPLLCVCGNHDVGNTPTPESLGLYESEFGKDHYIFWVNNCACIVINTNLYADPSHAEHLYSSQHAWLEASLEQLSQLNPQHIIVFGHHPLFLEDPSEDELPGVWESISGSGETFSIPRSYFHIPKLRRTPLLELLWKYKVKAMFAGHYHKSKVVSVPQHDFEMVTTAAVGQQALPVEGSGFRLVRVFADSISHRYFCTKDMPTNVHMDTEDW